MDYRRLIIKIAGAGSGKTYSLARKISELYKKSNNDKEIIAITYTNSARDNIRSEIERIIGFLPERIKISTAHEFLLSEIIYPFSKMILDIYYNKCVIYKLPSNNRFKSHKIKELQNENIIHSEVVVKVARKILCNMSNDTKKIKQKKKNAFDFFIANKEAILVDESQDFDKDFFKIFERIIEESDIYIYMVGDPKQSLRGVKDFETFSLKYIKNVNYIKGCRRCPQEILDISNLFCKKEHKQVSGVDKKGNLYYLYESDSKFSDFFQKFNGLKYIYQSNESFRTKNINNKIAFTKAIVSKVKEYKEYDYDALLNTFQNFCLEELKRTNEVETLKKLLEVIKIGSIPKNEYAEMLDNLKKVKYEKDERLEVFSIDKVKGLGDESCMFIMSNEIAKLFLNPESNQYNKLTNYLYTGLTRSSKDLYIVFDKVAESKISRELIDKNMMIKGISYFNC